MDTDEYLKDVISRLEALYHKMYQCTELPVFVRDDVYQRFRHETLSDALACYLKGVKIISTLNAALVLLKEGYTQEIGALCRMIDDYCNEIFFLLVPQDGEKFSADQIRFLEDFFQEELDRPDNPLASTQKRSNVPTRKIHSTCAKLSKNEANPSDAQEILRTVHQAFSGYVHGGYPHIMEMYGGNPPRFHMSGMLGTPRIIEWRNQLKEYVYRTIMVSILVARKLGSSELETAIKELMKEFEQRIGCAPTKKAAEMIRDIKKKKT